MGDKSVSFKVCLNDATSEPEVRRFVIDRDVSSSLSYLREKLITIFPALRRKDFKLTWTDDEGDKVTIRSDDELIIALTEMKGPVYKLAINILSDKDNSRDEEAGNSEGEEHPGVTCDGCEKPVVGFRYKCVICPDYDLCGQCETKGLHPGHNMIRIASPQGAWPHHFYRRLHRMHDKMQKRSSSFGAYPGRAEQEKHSWESTPTMFGMPCGGPEPSSGGAAAGRSGCSRPGNFGTQRQKWLDAMMKGWSGSAEEETTAHQAAHQAARETAHSHHQEIHQAAAAAAEAAATAFKQAAAAAHVAAEGDGKGKPPPQQTSFNDDFIRSAFNMTSPTDYLKNLGQMVASALDPLGVDVKIDVETPTGERININGLPTKKEEKSTQEDQKVDEVSIKSEEEKAPEEQNNKNEELEEALMDDSVGKMSQDDDNVSHCSSSFSKASTPDEKKDEAEDEDWTVVNKTPEATPVHVVEATPEAVVPTTRDIPIQLSDEPAKILYASVNGTLYPELPPQAEATQPKVEETAEVAEEAAAHSYYSKSEQKADKKIEKLEKKIEKKMEKLMKLEESKRAAEPEAVVYHPDPRIQVALQAMLNMGFTNDGGWLTQLLENKNGDIGKVLDVLQPVHPASRR